VIQEEIKMKVDPNINLREIYWDNLRDIYRNRYTQIRNPASMQYKLLDRELGLIVGESDSEFEGVELIETKEDE